MDAGWPRFPNNYFCKIIIASQIPTEVNLCENLQYIEFSFTVPYFRGFSVLIVIGIVTDSIFLLFIVVMYISCLNRHGQ